jgi:truncated hemoglobin YjbI
MNKKRFVVIGLLLMVALVLAACAPKEEMPAEMPQEVEESMPAEEVEAAPAEEEAEMEEAEPAEMEEPAEDAMDDDSMEAEDHDDDMGGELDVDALIEEKVAGNHDLERIFNAVKTRDEWEETLDRMIGYGAEINDEEKEIIIAYLLDRDSEEMEASSEVDVDALIEEKVAGNHDLGRIFNADKTREEWVETLDRMIGYGAQINDEEKEIIIEYLLNR